MALSADELKTIADVLARPDAEAKAYPELRSKFPHLSMTRCEASDLTETPIAVYERFELHLVDGSDHCVRIVPDMAAATGLVLARRGPAR